MFDLKRTYSEKDCYLFCSNLFALEKSNCSCKSSLIEFKKNCIGQVYEETTTNAKKCVLSYLQNFRENLQYESCPEFCPQKCDSMSYTISNYFEIFPAVGVIGNIVNIFLWFS
jgi:hypothetical protein